MVKDNLRRGNEEVGRGEGDSDMPSIDRGNSKTIRSRSHACRDNQFSHPPSGLVLFTACHSPRHCSFSSPTLVISSRILLSFCPMQCDGKERERSSVMLEEHFLRHSAVLIVVGGGYCWIMAQVRVRQRYHSRGETWKTEDNAPFRSKVT